MDEDEGEDETYAGSGDELDSVRPVTSAPASVLKLHSVVESGPTSLGSPASSVSLSQFTWIIHMDQ